MMKLQTGKHGYTVVNLKNRGAVKNVRVHRIVAQEFIPNPLSLPNVDHIDFNKANNAAVNLQWIETADNTRRSKQAGRAVYVKGSRHGMARLGEDDVAKILARKNERRADLAREFKTSLATIGRIIARTHWKHVELPSAPHS
jgi:hypothetical protein